MKLDIPFYSNTSDDTHCFQAALKMVLGYFLPERNYSWDELETITAKRKNLWTWPTAGVLYLKEMGFNVILMEDFDYQRFAKEGDSYLLEKYGDEVGKSQIEYSDISQERKFAEELIRKVKPVKKLPSLVDLKRLMQEGYIIVCNVNSQALNENPGYSGHFVVITALEDDKIMVHDPGLPAYPNRVVSQHIFDKAWAYPSADAKNLIAFKLETRQR